MQKCLHTSLTAAPCSLDAATGAAAAARPSPEPTRLSPGPGSLLWWHCALIRSRSWASSIPAPSSSVSSHPAAAAAAVAANRASQEDARCSWKEQAACTQPTSGKGREGKGRERKRGGRECRKGRNEVETTDNYKMAKEKERDGRVCKMHTVWTEEKWTCRLMSVCAGNSKMRIS